jgi:DNA repair exonuclease SbcCD ATPase subunit
MKSEGEAERLRNKLEDKGLSKEERAKAQEKLNQLKSNQMSKEDRDKLKNQMKDIREKVERLSRSKEEKEKALRDQAKKGDIDKDRLQNELERLDRDGGHLTEKDIENLKDLADKMDKAEQSLQEGNDADAAQQLEDAANQLGQLDRDGELQELAEKLEDAEGCKGAMCQSLDGNQPVPASGRRSESKDAVTNSVDQRERINMDKGKLSVIDTVPGQGFKGPKKPAELTEEIRKASQEAPEAIDRQRLPRSAGDMARGYFDKLRGEQEKKEKR